MTAINHASIHEYGISDRPQHAAGGLPRTNTTHLADTGITNEEELEEVVVLASVHGRRRGLEAGAGEGLGEVVEGGG